LKILNVLFVFTQMTLRIDLVYLTKKASQVLVSAIDFKHVPAG